MNKDILLSLAEEVAGKFFPEESIALSVGGEKWIEELEKGKTILSEEAISAEFEMGDSVFHLINSIWFLSATFNVYYQIHKGRKEKKRVKPVQEVPKPLPEEQDLKSLLLDELKKRIDEKTALEIVLQYGLDVERLVRGSNSDE